jgi:hypothetical protein
MFDVSSKLQKNEVNFTYNFTLFYANFVRNPSLRKLFQLFAVQSFNYENQKPNTAILIPFLGNP